MDKNPTTRFFSAQFQTRECSAASRGEVVHVFWMIDHDSSMRLPCRCLDSSALTVRIRIPLGYGVAVGQRYKLYPHLPGERPAPDIGVIGSAWVTIAEIRMLLEEKNGDHLDVLAVRIPLESVLCCPSSPDGATEWPAAA